MSIHLAFLRGAGVLVPRQQRPEWLAEWTAELCYVRQLRESCAIAFCLGAFPDALWLRRNKGHARLLESPLQCGLLLALAAFAAVCIAWLLPGGRNALLLSPYRDAEKLFLISRPTLVNSGISFADYQSLASHTQERFSAVAFYQTTRTRVGAESMPVALASGNLFALLDIPLAGREDEARLVLSDRAWRKYFHRDPNIIGRLVDIAGQKAPVAGVISADSWRLPGRVDAWLLGNTRLSQDKGLALGHLRNSGFHPRSDGFGLVVGADTYDCESLAGRARLPLVFFLTALACACIFLSATRSFALGAAGIRQWLFLVANVVCILPILYCFAALSIAWNGTAFGVLSFLAVFPGGFFAFRWILEDQRRRCPVCLRRLSKPVGFGQASYTFLGWYGTELTCVRGHGLLRVPEISSTWLSTQRWVYVDDVCGSEIGSQA
jgi:hypothetical protein